MHTAQEQVAEFHYELGHPIGSYPSIETNIWQDNKDLRNSLLLEETLETVKAVDEDDIVGIIDGMCDVLYVVYGMAITLGIDIEPFFNEVHRSNMDKKGGGIREDGKRLKPEGWKPPNIREVLNKEVNIDF